MDSIIYTDKAVEFTIERNQTDWNSNRTRCYKLHNLVIVVISCSGAPASNKVIATGLPAPVNNRAIEIYIGYPTSVGIIGTDGTLYIASPGTFDSSFISQTVAYLAES